MKSNLIHSINSAQTLEELRQSIFIFELAMKMGDMMKDEIIKLKNKIREVKVKK